MRAAGLMRVSALCLGLVATAAPAQDAQSLADIRADLAALNGALASLRNELTASGGSSVQVSGSTLDRINVIEAALQALTSQTERLSHRIETVVQDGTNRIGDLEFRICEIEPGCDIGAIGDTKPLGGESVAAPAAPAPAPAPAPSGGAQLAVSEEADYRRAQEALASGDFQSAAQQFATFRETFPGSPLEAAALLGEGNALTGLGDTREAARRYLSAYASYPSSDAAPEALWQLGVSLGKLGSTNEACVTLAEVGTRYPSSSAVAGAQAEMSRLGCQ